MLTTLFQTLAHTATDNVRGTTTATSTDPCQGLGDLVSLIKNGVMPIIQIGIPILLIIMGSVDLGKAVIASDEKAIKAAQSMLIKRIISAVAVFLVVTIVHIVFNMLGDANTSKDDPEITNNTSWWDCWVKS